MADDNSTTFCECPAGYEAECVFPEWSCPRKGSNDTDRPLQPTRNSSTEIERLATQIADEIVPYECNRNDDLRTLLLKFAKEIKLASIEGEFR